MTLSVVITSFNDNAELLATVQSLHATTQHVEVVIVDDASSPPVMLPPAGHRIVRTERRIGVGPARHLGALNARGTFILFVDSHCRFTPGWFEASVSRILDRPTTVHCGSCLGLGYNGSKQMNMDVTKPNTEYFGATWNFCGPDRNNPRQEQVFETIWAPQRDGDDYELSGIMGACYIVPREWYLRLNCGANLISYGCDEQELALKTWLAGGDCRMLKGLRIGHKFKEARKNQIMLPALYNATDYVIRNKMFLIQTILPKSHAEILLRHLRFTREFTNARKAVEADWHRVEIERARNQVLFKRDFSWFLSRFGFSFPSR